VPEASTVDVRRVLWAAGGALVLLIGAVAVLNSVYRGEVPVRLVPVPQKFPEPRLRVDERTQLSQFLAAQRQRLSTYRWTDDKHRVAQIPIERATQILVQEGAQAYAPLIASSPVLSSPTAGAERAITPGDGARPGPTTTGSSTTNTSGPPPPAAPDPRTNPQGGHQ